MGRHAKRRVKQRSKSHQTLVKAGRKKRVRSRRKVGFGTKLRRAKKSQAKGRK
jgi:hypothetical protein